ncbi:MAG: hypothetical protein EZS28_028209 [Streblomastix strix]|uniref:Cyclin N-terminal domain-containing protein n=1 Tax=Streblomastix strix TaxID=222440 RepID=A0A5J4V160_9EUKA|nr:MAG: hypothetical protein EZS28_028209 [Streblomastix strix]
MIAAILAQNFETSTKEKMSSPIAALPILLRAEIERSNVSTLETKTEIERTDTSDIAFMINSLSLVDRPDSDYMNLFSQKLFSIIESSPSQIQVISFQSIQQFICHLREFLTTSVEEGIIAIAIMERFMEKQAQKGMHVLNARNIGTMLVIVIVETMKMHRDHGYKNIFFANMFKIPLQALNQSEDSFLRIIDHSLFVSDEVFSRLFKEIIQFEDNKDSH